MGCWVNNILKISNLKIHLFNIYKKTIESFLLKIPLLLVILEILKSINLMRIPNIIGILKNIQLLLIGKLPRKAKNI